MWFFLKLLGFQLNADWLKIKHIRIKYFSLFIVFLANPNMCIYEYMIVINFGYNFLRQSTHFSTYSEQKTLEVFWLLDWKNLQTENKKISILFILLETTQGIDNQFWGNLVDNKFDFSLVHYSSHLFASSHSISSDFLPRCKFLQY